MASTLPFTAPRVSDEIVSSPPGFAGPRSLEDAGHMARTLFAGPFAYPMGAGSLAHRSSGPGSPDVAQCHRLGTGAGGC